MEPGQLEHRVAFVHGQPQQSPGIVRSPGQGPPPVQEREPFLGLPAPERVQGEAGQGAGNQGRRTGGLGDLQRPVQRGQDVLPPSLGGPQENMGIVEPRLGVLG